MKNVTGKKINESVSFILEVLKISSDKNCQQDCISKLRNIRIKNVNNVITGTLKINSLAWKCDKFKLVVSGNFNILIITETKLDYKFPTSQFNIESFSMSYMLNRNRNGGGIIIYVGEDIPTKTLKKTICRKILKESFLK